MSTLHLNFREGKSRALLVVVMVLSLIAGFVVATSPKADADVNTGIKVSDLKLSASDQNGNPLGADDPANPRPIDRNTAARLDFNWDASQTRVNSGDSFEIDLPEQFASWRNYDKNPLYVDYNGQQVQVGVCSSEPKKIDCTFNEKIDELNAEGYRGTDGTGWAVLKVLGEHPGPNIDFVVNGVKTPVGLPGGKIGPIPGDYHSMGFGKMSAYLGPDTKSIVWDINFNSTHVKNLLNGKPEALTLDGKTSQTITFEDVLGPGQKFNPETGKFHLMIRNSKEQPANILKPLAFVDSSKDGVATEYGDFTIKFDAKGDQEGTFTVAGPWAEETNYKIVYTSVPTSDDGNVVRDHDYYNESTIKGSNEKAFFTRRFSQSFEVTAKLLAGFGSIDLIKKVTNDTNNAVPADSEYLVNIEYTLPNGTTAADHPAWRTVGDLNDTKTGGTASVSLKANEVKKFTGQFPTGTTVKLTEEVSTLPNGVEWRDPVFKIDGNATDTFTVQELKRASVELTNDVAQADVSPRPNPTTSPSSTTTATSEPSSTTSATSATSEPTSATSEPTSATTSATSEPTSATDEPTSATTTTSANGGSSSGGGSGSGSSAGSSASPWWLLLGLGLIPLAFFLPHGMLKHFHPKAQAPAQRDTQQEPTKEIPKGR